MQFHSFIRHIFFLIIMLNSLESMNCSPNRNQERSLADPALADDIKWLFRGIGNFAGTVERMLPNVKLDTKNNTFAENTRLSLLAGMRHVLVGVREISTTFEKSFKTDHIKQLQQFKNATNFVNDIISALKMWLSQVRALVMHLYTLYNRYIPEVLFGKCLGNYMASMYPNRSYYEYPFILLADMYATVITTESTTTSPPTAEEEESVTELNIDDDLNMAQNEILHTDDSSDYDVGPFSTKARRDLDGRTQTSQSSNAENAGASESFFNLSNVLGDDKDKIIEDAVQQQSWQICLKLYTAESISRSLKSYFLNL